MADIDLYQEDNDDNTDDALFSGYGLDDGLDCDEPFGTDDNLSPLQKLEKYMESDNVYTRQMVAKGLLDTLRAVGDSEEQTTAVLTNMVKLSDDSDPIVRSELMEQIAHIAVYCHDNRDIFHNAIPVYILPMVVRYLDDANNQVRKTSQAALLVLLEQELVDRDHIEEQVVSVILELASADSLDEYRTEAVALMSKMAPLLGKEMTERVFLSRFCEMCCDPLFHVRKVCAANFGDFSSVVSQDSAEQQLLPKFYFLCEDGVWGVRKACAECFMAVSCACSVAVRKTDLSSLFVNLLCDQSRWVRMAAFQQLGPFISTFADSDLTGMHVDLDGSLVFRPNEDYKKRHSVDNQSIETKLSDIRECDRTSVPEVIVTPQAEDSVCTTATEYSASTTETSSSASPNCDTESNLSQIEMDMSEDALSGDGKVSTEPVDSTESSDQSVTEDQSTVETEGSSVDSVGDTVESGSERSVEEIRAEHYQGIGRKDVGEGHTINESDGGDNKTLIPSDNIDTNVNSNNDLESAGSLEDSNNANSTTTDGSGIDNDNTICDNKEQTVDDVSAVGTVSSPVAPTDDDSKSGLVHIHIDNSNDFNAFNYWRTPLPQLDIDLEMVEGTPRNIHVTARVSDEERHKVYASEMNVDLTGDTPEFSSALSDSLTDLSVCDKNVSAGGGEAGAAGEMHVANVSSVAEEMVNQLGSTHVLGEHMGGNMTVIDGMVQDLSGGAGLAYIDSDFSTSPHSYRDSLVLDDATLAQQQDIVPQSLLENYLGMIDPSRAQTVDTEITKYCAYNLPAVAYTLGRTNWHCIKNLYETLAADMQWKVRRTLAFSIHELAVILGEEITHRDLVPVFDGFLKDLDEVRIGILRHLADFLRLLHPDVRSQYLLKVQDFMNVDNNRNWRFRMELAEQLVLISELYSAQEISEYLLPLAISLAEDKVSEVRIDAYHLLSVMLKRMLESNDEKLVQYLVSQLVGRFAYNQKWARRQIYTQLCQAIILEEAMPPVQFAKDFLPSLLALKNDPVPNVRISLAKSIASYMDKESYSDCDDHPYKTELEEAVAELHSDRDRDVRYFCVSHSSLDHTTILNTSSSLSDSMSSQIY